MTSVTALIRHSSLYLMRRISRDEICSLIINIDNTLVDILLSCRLPISLLFNLNWNTSANFEEFPLTMGKIESDAKKNYNNVVLKSLQCSA